MNGTGICSFFVVDNEEMNGRDFLGRYETSDVCDLSFVQHYREGNESAVVITTCRAMEDGNGHPRRGRTPLDFIVQAC